VNRAQGSTQTELCGLVSDYGRRAAGVEWACGSVSVGLCLPWMQQTQSQEAPVDRVAADCPEPAQLPHRPWAAHHPRGLLGWEREVRASNTPKQILKLSEPQTQLSEYQHCQSLIFIQFNLFCTAQNHKFASQGFTICTHVIPVPAPHRSEKNLPKKPLIGTKGKTPSGDQQRRITPPMDRSNRCHVYRYQRYSAVRASNTAEQKPTVRPSNKPERIPTLSEAMLTSIDSI